MKALMQAMLILLAVQIGAVACAVMLINNGPAGNETNDLLADMTPMIWTIAVFGVSSLTNFGLSVVSGVLYIVRLRHKQMVFRWQTTLIIGAAFVCALPAALFFVSRIIAR